MIFLEVLCNCQCPVFFCFFVLFLTYRYLQVQFWGKLVMAISMLLTVSMKDALGLELR